MAMHKSAKKRILRNTKRSEMNIKRMSRVRTFIRKVLEAVKAGDYEASAEALKTAQPEIHRAASKGLIHAKTAARKISRLSAKVKAVKG